MIKNGDNVILKFRIFNGELCRDNGKAYIYPSMDRVLQYHHPDHEELVEYTPVVHGHWVDENGFTFMPLPKGHRWCHCDKCGHTIMGIPSNYCPNCGADMRGEP